MDSSDVEMHISDVRFQGGGVLPGTLRGSAMIPPSLTVAGYGSFTYLQRLHLTYPKNDIRFVLDLLTNEANQHLVKATVKIAQSFALQRSRRASRTTRRSTCCAVTALIRYGASTSDARMQLSTKPSPSIDKHG